MLDIKEELEKNYNIYKYKIACYEDELKNVFDNCLPSVTPSYSNSGFSGKGGTSDKVYNAVEKMENKREKLLEAINFNKSKINMLDNLIATQNNKAQLVIKERALSGKEFSVIACELKDKHNIDIFSIGRVKQIYYDSLKNMQEIQNKFEKGV